MKPQDTQSPAVQGTSSYESPTVTDISDGTSPLVAAPGQVLPSGIDK